MLVFTFAKYRSSLKLIDRLNAACMRVLLKQVKFSSFQKLQKLRELSANILWYIATACDTKCGADFNISTV